MARKLIDRLKDNLDNFDFSAMNATARELEYIRNHKDLLWNLLNYEGQYEHEAFVGQEISYLNEPMKLIKVSTRPLPVDLPFQTLTVCCQYDRLDWQLLAADYVNYFAKIRDSYEDPLIYGPTERWVIWSTGLAQTLNKVEVVGKLSALHMNFPDEVTALIARDAGVYAADFQIPLMLYRVGSTKKGNLIKFPK